MLVRLGIKMCIEDAKAGITVEASFSDAEDALPFFENYEADILVTDIRLPGMNGLELIERVKVLNPHLLTLVISCYEEFDYARKAMELGVDKYILKHELSEEKLPGLLAGLYQAKEQDQKKVKYTLAGNETQWNPNLCYRVGIIALRKSGADRCLEPEDIDFHILQGLAQEILDAHDMGECFLRHLQELFCIMPFSDKADQDGVRAQIYSLYQELKRTVKKYFNANVFLSISCAYKKIENSRELFEPLKRNAVSFFYEETSTLEYVDAARCSDNLTLKTNDKYIFSKDWFLATRENLEVFFKEAREKKVLPEVVKNECVRLIYSITDRAAQYYGIDANMLNSGVDAINDEEGTPALSHDARVNVRQGHCWNYQSVNGFDSCSGLEKYMMEMLDCLSRMRLASLHNDKKIYAWVEQNYSKEISLEQAASAFHMSAPYFCQYFKKNTGDTFVRVMNRVRIEKACLHLQNPDITIEQAAKEVGICNVNYFMRLFKKITGETVGEYRNRTLKL